MPLKINVGLSRKVGENNYGSKGASINIEMELDGSLANDPAMLQQRIRQLFGLVRDSVKEELNGNGTTGAAQNHGTTGNGNGNGHNGNGNGNGNSTAPSKPARQATESQVKAIFAICKSNGFDMSRVLREHFQVDRAETLTVKQASTLIDRLKNGGSS